MNARSYPVTVTFLLGLLAVFVGERIFGEGTARNGFTAAGVLLVAVGFAWRLGRWAKAPADRKPLERWFVALQTLVVAALVLYFVPTWIPASPEKTAKLPVILAALYPALLVLGVIPMLLLEASAHAMARSPIVETERARSALFGGFGTAFLVLFVFSAMYVATAADATWDWSYFRTAKPGDSSKAIARGLTEPVQVTLFFPPANEVGDAVKQYFKELGTDAPQLQVESLDQAVDVARARELRVSSNGTVVIARGTRRETLSMGLDLDKVRGQLQKLDQDVQKRLLTVSKAKRNVYFTTGHGERGDTVSALEAARPNVNQLKEVLRSQNIEVRTLSSADGLANEVPTDAALLVIVGPTRPFAPEEVATVRAYQAKGGAVWLALEPGGPDLSGLLAPLGLKQLPGTLANREVFFTATRQPSDRTNLATANFSSHPSVSTLSAAGAQLPVAFLGAAPLELVRPLPNQLSQDNSVRGHPATFQDVNGNFEADEGEKKAPWPLAYAIELQGATPSRNVVLADADAISDFAFGNMGNSYLALDASRWLTRDEAIAGSITSEEDVPVQHTRREDSVWFYGSVFLAPALVLALGFLVTRSRRTSRGARPTHTVAEGSAR